MFLNLMDTMVFQVFNISLQKEFLKIFLQGLPGSPVIKALPSNAKDAGSIPGQGVKIPHALWPKNQNIQWKQYSNKFSEGFKNVPHPKIFYF